MRRARGRSRTCIDAAAVRIPCPFCGARDIAEFACRGAVLPARPDPQAADAPSAFHDWLYLRENLAGELDEHWYHAAGCRRWMVVRRDTRDHRILGAHLAGEAAS